MARQNISIKQEQAYNQKECQRISHTLLSWFLNLACLAHKFLFIG
ncbi:hypothetical protein DSUL_30093 [Desulfovibrionales bacterium]